MVENPPTYVTLGRPFLRRPLVRTVYETDLQTYPGIEVHVLT